jgi:hypothetical protein
MACCPALAVHLRQTRRENEGREADVCMCGCVCVCVSLVRYTTEAKIISIYVCVRVCERERETMLVGERERERLCTRSVGLTCSHSSETQVRLTAMLTCTAVRAHQLELMLPSGTR